MASTNRVTESTAASCAPAVMGVSTLARNDIVLVRDARGHRGPGWGHRGGHHGGHDGFEHGGASRRPNATAFLKATPQLNGVAPSLFRVEGTAYPIVANPVASAEFPFVVEDLRVGRETTKEIALGYERQSNGWGNHGPRSYSWLTCNVTVENAVVTVPHAEGMTIYDNRMPTFGSGVRSDWLLISDLQSLGGIAPTGARMEGSSTWLAVTQDGGSRRERTVRGFSLAPDTDDVQIMEFLMPDTRVVKLEVDVETLH